MLLPYTAVPLAFRSVLDFKGRSRRSEFWWFVVFSLLVVWGVGSLEEAILGPPTFEMRDIGLGKFIDEFTASPVTDTIDWVLTFTLLSVGTRRLHDVGKRAWPFLCGYLLSIVLNFMHPVKNPEHRASLSKDNISFDAYFTLSNYEVMSPFYTIIVGIVVSSVLYLLFWALFDGQTEPNQFGENPKYKHNNDVFN